MATQQLARQAVQELTPYQSARRIGGHGNIWLNANESPDNAGYPNPEQRLNRYPEFQPPELIEAYAQYSQLTSAQILAGRGADEAIDLLIRAYCEPRKDQIVINPPTYGMYAICAKTWGINIIEQPVDADYNPDYQALTQLDAKLFFICSPNNPTGNVVDLEKVAQLAKQKRDKALIVIDEAYIEFAAEYTAQSLLAAYDNIVILRTLSKAFALAGARCGFILAHPDVINTLSKVIAPYPVPTPVAVVATEVLTTRLNEMYERVEIQNEIRRQFIQEIEKLDGIAEIFSATGNFILIRFSNPDVFKHMSEQGIVLRDFDDKPKLKSSIRISIGTQQEMEATLASLKQFIAASEKDFA
ncbi:histidinol-phosphate transaminase [Celerinatantimonas sp. YJH-8]|uniref:histidinol-phosphate transaminase n=1 Tax=Celerinatantimonas sp. YJH-8 TaxID=3228714 RepID=UPI0038CA5B23